jgi:threonine dehydratase
VRAGHGIIGLEIMEQLPDVEAIVIPYGGGGLSCGIATGIRALKPDTKLYACEVETAERLFASSPEETSTNQNWCKFLKVRCHSRV